MFFLGLMAFYGLEVSKAFLILECRGVEALGFVGYRGVFTVNGSYGLGCLGLRVF